MVMSFMGISTMLVFMGQSMTAKFMSMSVIVTGTGTTVASSRHWRRRSCSHNSMRCQRSPKN